MSSKQSKKLCIMYVPITHTKHETLWFTAKFLKSFSVLNSSFKVLEPAIGCLAGPSSSTRRIVDWETTTNSSNYKGMLQYQMCNYCTAFSYHLTYFFSKFMLIKYWDIYLNKTKIIQIELLLIIIKCNVYSVVVNSKGQSALAKYEWILLKAQWAKSQVIQDLM